MNFNKFVVFICSLSIVGIASADLEERVSALEAEASISALENNLSLGGYGEFHLNNSNGKNKMDYHRVVLYAGYQFNDWIRLNSEIELEHSKAGAGDELTIDGTEFDAEAAGYVLLEQFSVDLQVTESTAIRMGRTLAPLGIVGLRHEPPLFFGVERPNVEKYILPSTWSVDGIGLVGDLSENISYEIYAVAGLDGSKFSTSSGIRSGRIADYPSFESPSYTGRLDYHGVGGLRVGAAFYQGGADDKSGGTGNGLSDSEVSITSFDAEYSVGALSLNTLIANGSHENTAVADSDFSGSYYTAGYEIWRSGEKAIIPFVRLSEYQTHDSVDTIEGTKIGANIYLSNQFVLKADLLTEEEGGTETDTFSVGFGMMFQ